ncbi:hypothetical protein ACFWBF_29240 [Streptomyces sp. NPDC060028]|uniref:hypothetical protein n=1 Tax=Streptomyces sp. NPDC060028 TaxID=3347041 RepID=UPI0036C7AF1F
MPESTPSTPSAPRTPRPPSAPTLHSAALGTADITFVVVSAAAPAGYLLAGLALAQRLKTRRPEVYARFAEEPPTETPAPTATAPAPEGAEPCPLPTPFSPAPASAPSTRPAPKPAR